MTGFFDPLNSLGASSSVGLAEALAKVGPDLAKASTLGSVFSRNQALSPLLPLSPAPSFLGSASAHYPMPPLQESIPTPSNALFKLQTKRKAYFAFRFEDIMRVNNVRNAWRINHPDSPTMRSFYDRSILGKSKAREHDSLKALMRDAVTHSSAVCVLVGTHTWQGRWVKYEIARAVADGRGLLAVHINGLNHHQRQAPDPRGYNPLDCMGIYHSPKGPYYLYELKGEVDPKTGELIWVWRQYEDFKDAIPLPRYIPSIMRGYVMPLATYTSVYDYPNGGHANIGAWIDRAAEAVGR